MIFKKIGNMENVEVICHYLLNNRLYSMLVFFRFSIPRKISSNVKPST